MSRHDFRGCAVSGATPAALDAFERALASFLSWRNGAEEHLATALREAPAFVMAHVLQAYLRLSSRDPAHVRAVRPILARAAGLGANARERHHLAAIAAVLADDYERAKALLGALLREHPRDALALQVAHALDYVTGDLDCMAERLPAALPAWSRELSGYHAVLAMQAFSLEESGHYERAREFAQQALAFDPLDARAHHVVAHVFEMTGRADAGLDWMYRNVPYWAVGTVVAVHGWWHVALFHLAKGQVDDALSLYDGRIRAGRSPAMSDMIDAASLLWRIELLGGNVGARWGELAAAWAPHVADGFCTFTDVHAAIAFAGARDWNLAKRLEHELVRRCSQPGRYGETTRQVGLTACRGIIAFGRGDHARAVDLLRSLPAFAHRIGGSHAQRHVLQLTLGRAVERVGRWNAARQPGRAARKAERSSLVLQ